ncbi:MAG: tagaturonate reductase [Promicromonosporaceae bacterium]|nr:tagaturonate reductase [Promicromonosporaceae bacterium]
MRSLSAATTRPQPTRPSSIMQFGGGNFLRAFVDVMIQRADDAGVMNAGVVVVHATPGPDFAVDILRKQDGRYHVLLEGISEGEPIREFVLVDCINEIIYAHEEFAEYRKAYLRPELTTIISNTTEAGIAWVPGDDVNAQPPASFPAKIASLLRDRCYEFSAAPDKGLRIVCCELIEDNGSTLREYVLRHARDNEFTPEVIEWIENACSFHDTLVDRIVPGYPRAEIESIWAELGVEDQVLVKGEYFGVWAIATGEPGGSGEIIREVLPLDKAGEPVIFMPDIRGFRAKKVKILNGLHTAMTQVGLLRGRAEVRETVEDLDIATYLGHLLHGEVLPSIAEYHDADSQAELMEFADKITERFRNPFLKHKLSDIALNSISKWQARNLPVALSARERGEEAPATVFALAALAVLVSGAGFDAERVKKSGFEPKDDPELLEVIRGAFPGADATNEQLVDWFRAIIKQAGFFAAESNEQGIADSDWLASKAAPYAAMILQEGIKAALKAYFG